jgi:methionyl aminopeptidase
MPVLLKRPTDIDLMRASGVVVAEVHAALRSMIAPGVTTRELDAVAFELIQRAGGHPSFLGYRGYPASICASINDEVLHGIPGDRELRDGDIISIDVGVYLDGFHADAAFTAGVGAISQEAHDLIEITERCFWTGFNEIAEGRRLGDVAAVIQHLAESEGYGVVREYAGHGVGRKMHEDPSVPNWGKPGSGSRIRNGMTFALEPMITAGTPETSILSDGWTVVTVDGSLSAHFEHTIAVTEEGVRLLTIPADGVI